MEQLHNTELWASYLPRVPRGFYFLAVLGLYLIGLSFGSIRSGSTLSAPIAIGLGVLLILPAVLMWLFVRWRSRHRLSLRRRILDSIPWRGDEIVLDVGCGSGLLLNGAALRLTSGKAIGIDLWVPHGGGGNLGLLMKNARAENVADRIEFREADAREMPFADGEFDVVLSSGALHHISRDREDFARLMQEMVRVLKPGGQVVIWDVAHFVEASASRLKADGFRCEFEQAGRFWGYEMGIVTGTKTS